MFLPLFLLFTPLAQAHVVPCSELLTIPVGLPSHMHSIIRAIEGLPTELKLQILVRTSSDGDKSKPRIVLILGESHAQTEEAFHAAYQLVMRIPFRGLEGANLNGYLSGQEPIKIVHQVATILDRIIRHAVEFMFTGSTPHPSTYVAAHCHPSNCTVAEMTTEIATLMAEKIENRGHESTDEEREDLRYWTVVAQNTKNIPLEANHRPGFWEDYYDLHTIIADWFRPQLTLLALGTALNDPAFTHLPTVAFAAAALALQIQHAFMNGTAPSERWREHLLWLDPRPGLLYDRDVTMAQNIVKGLDAHPEQRTMLVIVGKAHVSGLTRLLTEEYGFVKGVAVTSP